MCACVWVDLRCWVCVELIKSPFHNVNDVFGLYPPPSICKIHHLIQLLSSHLNTISSQQLLDDQLELPSFDLLFCILISLALIEYQLPVLGNNFDDVIKFTWYFPIIDLWRVRPKVLKQLKLPQNLIFTVCVYLKSYMNSLSEIY